MDKKTIQITGASREVDKISREQKHRVAVGLVEITEVGTQDDAGLDNAPNLTGYIADTKKQDVRPAPKMGRPKADTKKQDQA